VPYVIYFPLFSFLPTAFRSFFLHYFRPFSLFLSTFLSLRNPFFPLCFFCKRISPCKFAIEHRGLSAIFGRYVTIYACVFWHCALTEFYVVYRLLGSWIFVWGTVALLKRRVSSVVGWFWVIGCLFSFVVLLIMTMYWHADTCITSRYFLQLRFFFCCFAPDWSAHTTRCLAAGSLVETYLSTYTVKWLHFYTKRRQLED